MAWRGLYADGLGCPGKGPWPLPPPLRVLCWPVLPTPYLVWPDCPRPRHLCDHPQCWPVTPAPEGARAPLASTGGAAPGGFPAFLVTGQGQDLQSTLGLRDLKTLYPALLWAQHKVMGSRAPLQRGPREGAAPGSQGGSRMLEASRGPRDTAPLGTRA